MNSKRGHDNIPEHGEWATIKAQVRRGQANMPEYGKWAAIKYQVGKIDTKFMHGYILRGVRNQFGLLKLRNVTLRREYKFIVRYNKDITSPLSLLCDKYGSDKGCINSALHPHYWSSHTYADYYSLLFGHSRDSMRNVFECGIGNAAMGEGYKPGASLRVWRDYFPHANIVGADVLEENLFTDDRIETHYVDQTDPDSVHGLWDSISTKWFDLMIDDGLHTYDAGVCLFENSIQKLARNGVYVIEDVSSKNLFKFRNYFSNKAYVVEFVSLTGPNASKIDNNMVVIRKQDSP